MSVPERKIEFSMVNCTESVSTMMYIGDTLEATTATTSEMATVTAIPRPAAAGNGQDKPPVLSR